MKALLRLWTAVSRERAGLIALLPRAGAGVGAVLVGWNVVSAAMPPVTALAAGQVVARVSSAAGDLGSSGVLAAVAGLIGVLALTQLAESAQEIAGLAAARRIDGWARRRAREVAQAPDGIGHLEDPDFRDDLVRASDMGERGRRRSPGTAVVGQVLLIFRVIGAVAAAVVIARFSLVLAIFLLVGSLAARTIIRRQWMRLAEIGDAAVPGERRTQYLSGLAASGAAAKDVRLFGLGEWLVGRRRESALAWLAPVRSERHKILRRQGATAVLAFSTALAALLVPAAAAARGDIDAAELAACLVAAWGVFGISFMGHEAYDIDYGVGAVRALRRISAASAVEPRMSRSRMKPADSPHRIVCEGVTFRYPGTERAVLENLHFEIGPREVLAVVGRNGAGKTTLVKLLSGLYQPTAGRITVDGVDLATMDLRAWRDQMFAVFQDFVHYPASAHDNIALAAPGHLLDERGVHVAAEQAGAYGMLAHLPDGLDTPLWRGVLGGVDLSGGQWQKVAIARALFAAAHGRRLLVLDEPTANLDVQAEAEFFDCVVAAAPQASVVIISHRLSTIRRADRIVLLGNGGAVEEGSHEELLRLGGEYARLFRIQSARFHEESST